MVICIVRNLKGLFLFAKACSSKTPTKLQITNSVVLILYGAIKYSMYVKEVLILQPFTGNNRSITLRKTVYTPHG